MRRLAATTLAVFSLVAAISSTAAALEGYAESGVVADGPGALVEAVDPAGFGWRDGIRAGQPVVRLVDSLSPGGWVIETTAGDRHIVSRAASWDNALRFTLPLGIAAMVAGGLAVLLLRGHRSWTPAAASVALALSAPALSLHGTQAMSVAVIGSGAIAPAIWLAWRPHVPLAVQLLASGLIGALIIAWAQARLNGASDFDQIETLRDATATWGTVLVVLVSVVLPVVRAEPLHIGRPRLADVLLVALAGGVALAAIAVFSVPPIVPGAAILGVLLLLPPWRRALGSRAEELLLADVRDRAEIDAAEAERAHLARELHDAPLQQLAGVIRRLELIPAARAENDQLRAVAEQLRSVATELRPPVLDDLGLAAAVEFVAEKEATSGLAILVRLDDASGLDASSRPPSTVELAVFRIVQEAITNAIRHAQATTVRVSGAVGPERIDLEVSDDGRGLVDEEIRSAARRGRLGMASMHRRAEAIDADLAITGSGAGTIIRVRWQR